MQARGFTRFAAVLLALLATAATFSYSNTDGKRSAMAEIETIKKLTGLDGLDKGRIVHFAFDAVGEQSLRVIVSMPSSAFDGFLAANQLKREAFRVGNHGLLGVDEGAWDPRAYPAFPAASLPRPKGQYLYIGSRPKDHDEIIYIYWFMT